MIETHGIYTVSSSTHSPSMSLITRSYQLAWLLLLKFTQQHTSGHAILLIRQVYILLHPRLHPHFTKFITAAWAGIYWSIIISGRVKLPITFGRRREARMAFPNLSPNSELRNALVEYAMLVSQSSGEGSSPQMHGGSTRTTESNSFWCIRWTCIVGSESYKPVVSFLR